MVFDCAMSNEQQAESPRRTWYNGPVVCVTELGPLNSLRTVQSATTKPTIFRLRSRRQVPGGSSYDLSDLPACGTSGTSRSDPPRRIFPGYSFLYFKIRKGERGRLGCFECDLDNVDIWPCLVQPGGNIAVLVDDLSFRHVCTVFITGLLHLIVPVVPSRSPSRSI